MKKTISLTLILALAVVPGTAKADFTFGTPTNVGPTVNTSVEDGGPSISMDGLSLYCYSFLNGWAQATLGRDVLDEPPIWPRNYQSMGRKSLPGGATWCDNGLFVAGPDGY